jgi:hypothetical protein
MEAVHSLICVATQLHIVKDCGMYVKVELYTILIHNFIYYLLSYAASYNTCVTVDGI